MIAVTVQLSIQTKHCTGGGYSNYGSRYFLTHQYKQKNQEEVLYIIRTQSLMMD